MPETDTLAALAAQLQALQQQAQPQAAQPAAGGWAQPQQPQAGALPSIHGVAVPLSIETPMGKVRVYLSLGPEAAQSPQALMTALESIAAAGLPLDAWQPRESRGGWGGAGGRPSGGGWNRPGGGYGRGGRW